MTTRIGSGYDVHAFTQGRPLILGGVTIPFDYGLAGHSDADTVIHAIVDALLGAAAWATSVATSPHTIPAGKISPAPSFLPIPSICYNSTIGL